jgi:hypothetical protein
MPMSNYWRNLVIDFLRRGESLSPPATRYIALFTTAPTPSTSGTEVSASGYARIAVASDLTEWSGTQGAGTTGVSSGTTGRTSNNSAVTFHAAVPANWLGIVAWGEFDALTAGNLLDFGYLVDTDNNPVTRDFYTGDAVAFPADALSITYN